MLVLFNLLPLINHFVDYPLLEWWFIVIRGQEGTVINVWALPSTSIFWLSICPASEAPWTWQLSESQGGFCNGTGLKGGLTWTLKHKQLYSLAVFFRHCVICDKTQYPGDDFKEMSWNPFDWILCCRIAVEMFIEINISIICVFNHI